MHALLRRRKFASRHLHRGLPLGRFIWRPKKNFSLPKVSTLKSSSCGPTSVLQRWSPAASTSPPRAAQPCVPRSTVRRSRWFSTSPRRPISVLSQKNIQRVEDLRGKMIGVGGNWGTQFYMVLEALKHYGADKDVQL